MSRDETTLIDILKAARLARSFVQGIDKVAFLADAKSQSAALHQITLIGEAVRRVSPQFRELHPNIPWRQIAGMRDILIHQYNTVDLEEVWKTIESDLPRLIDEVAPLCEP